MLQRSVRIVGQSLRQCNRYGIRNQGRISPTTARAFGSYTPLTTVNQSLPFNTIAELQQNACKQYASHDVFGTRVGDKFEWITYHELDVMVSGYYTII